jgi:hypothetical protein
MKFHVLMQVENVSAGIRDFPSFRQSRPNIQVLVSGAEVIEEQLVNALGLRIQTNPRIEIGGAVLDDHNDCVGNGFG